MKYEGEIWLGCDGVNDHLVCKMIGNEWCYEWDDTQGYGKCQTSFTPLYKLIPEEGEVNSNQDMMTQAEYDGIEQLEKSALEMSERDVEDALLASPLDACTSSEVDFENETQQAESLVKQAEWEFDENGLPPLGVDVMVSYTADGDPDGWCESHGPSQLVAFEFGMVWIAHHGVHHRLHKAEDVEFTKYVKPESSEEKAKRELTALLWGMKIPADASKLADLIISSGFGYRKPE